MRNKGDRILISSSCIVSKTVIKLLASVTQLLSLAIRWLCSLLSDVQLQGEGYCKSKHQIGDAFSIESKEKRCKV